MRPTVFVPNNDIAPARRMRIRKTLEFGACRAESWQKNVTHVIADRDLCFKDVVRYLKLNTFPVGRR
jgi:hypothetical protein